jgi:hypothetical protein
MRTLLLILLLSNPTHAGFIGFYEGNDNAPVVSGIVGHEVELLGKIETEGNTLTYEGEGDQVLFQYTPFDGSGLGYVYWLASVPKDDGPFMSGTLELIGDLDIEYFAAKAGNGFNLYEWEDGVINEWSTVNTCKALSHISFYGHAMPEPGALTLAGLGLLGVFHLTRRRR